MKSITIVQMAGSYDAADRLYERLEEQAKAEASGFSVIRRPYSRYRELVCFQPEGLTWPQGDKRKIIKAVSSSLAKYIVQEKEDGLLRTMLTRLYKYKEADEHERIVAYCREIPDFQPEPAKGKAEAVTRREKALAAELEKHMKKNPDFNLDGLLLFRLPEYREELQEMLEYAVDEYMMDKQYQEFISLLKYFVFIQQAKIMSVHLVHTEGNEFTLYNEEMEPIQADLEDSGITIETPDREFNFEDLIVSTLITVAPRSILIHTLNPDFQVIQTILQIFDEKAKVCDQCAAGKSCLDNRPVKSGKLSP
ncbi:putative sporulation protein YtxC [Paenibacillus aurantius]|uniref:Sporulation protein YtxC n=1 Tax=Paenibacillus aurantius TaxID=2918900 RepID=A0AA96RDV7_9BACL|nr:putative sporulation protein YtxC [Paenibacillus aurantius]WNQ10197.1 putative sporulation protein YtxC [Paenibacillus aurantius]